jgi:zinc and cadmium transporter
MLPLVAIFVYCAVIVAGSLAGGWLPAVARITHTRMQVLISFAGGLMLGVGLFHMLPHAAAAIGSLDRTMVAVAAGLLGMFFLIRALDFHHHEVPGAAHEHEHGHADGHGHGHAHGHGDQGHHRLAWVGMAVGLALHTLIDGVALAASVVAEAADAGHGHDHGRTMVPGIGTFLAVLLHKPLCALAITTLMAAGGWASRTLLVVNACFALMCPLGALLFYVGAGSEPGPFVGYALAFSAGVFRCVSRGDLLPEVQFHSHDRIKLSVALLLGIAVAYAIGFLESHGGHAH